MAHSSRAVANALIVKAARDGNPLTPMQIIKLVYICQGWMLGLYGRPLIREPVEAWLYGPVVPDLYRCLRKYGGGYVTEEIPTPRTESFDEIESDLIEQVWDQYGRLSGPALSRLTHSQGSPWHTIWEMKGQNSVIPTDIIEDHYAQLAADD